MYDHEIESKGKSSIQKGNSASDLALVNLKRLELFGIVVVVELETCVATALKPLLCDISTTVDF
jgi:hypothetical protein